MGRIEKLTRFQYHLHDVFVDMPTCSLAWLPMEDEDIHSGGLSAPHTPSRRISNFLGITLDGFQIFWREGLMDFKFFLGLLSTDFKFSWSGF